MKQSAIEMEGALRGQPQAVRDLNEEVRVTKADIESHFQKLDREIREQHAVGTDPAARSSIARDSRPCG